MKDTRSQEERFADLDRETDALFALIDSPELAKKNEKAAIAIMKQGKLPKYQLPCRQAFEELGFQFSESDSLLFYNAVYPQKWYFEYEKYSRNTFYLCDGLKRRMAEVKVYVEVPNPYAKVTRITRYQVKWFFLSSDEIVAIYDNEERTYIKIVYAAYRPSNENIREEKEHAIEWLNKHFPDWKDPFAYWT